MRTIVPSCVALCVLMSPACDESGRAPPPDADRDGQVLPDGAEVGPDGATDNDATGPQPDAGDATVAPDGGDADTRDTTLDPDTIDYTIPEAAPPSLRRLSARELERSYAAVVGFAPEAVKQVPPDPRDFTFDRVVNAQTISTIHAEAYDAAAREAAERLVAERRLDDLAPSCHDDILPPAAEPSASVTVGIALVAYPDWALNPGEGNPDRLMIRYAEECGVSTSFAAPSDGTYRVTLDVDLEPSFDIALAVDGSSEETWHLTGAHMLSGDVALVAGTHQIGFDFVYDETANPYVYVQSLTIVGPIDPGATRDADARAACRDDLIDALARRAWRRPVTAAERERLQDLHGDGLAAGGSWGEATRMVVRAILGSPKFLYLIETGAPVANAPGRFALDAWQVAQRLSYAICEMPPDADLVEAVRQGRLQSEAQIAAEAERLFALPCAADTLARFYRQWLWLDRLASTAKDPELYPEFTAATATSFAREADRFLHAITFEEGGDITALHAADHTFVDDLGAAIYGLPPVGVGAEGTLARVDLPPERTGLLTLPGVLAVTAKFKQTSPVIRGVYVLEQILCDELPAPPDEVDTTPPELDPSATTRERWAAHSESGACAPCHQRIDPIGFTFEEFDAMGRYRTSENGLPIDARGAAPILGVREDTLDGVDDLAALVASSDLATTCLARQWLRFALGRMEEVPDGGSIATIAAALRGPSGSLRDGFVALMSTRAFRERVERQDDEGGEP